jgi:hypothetical protein
MALRINVNGRDHPGPSNSFREEAEDNNETFNTTDRRCSSPSVKAENARSNNGASSSEGNHYVLLLQKALKKGKSYGVKLGKAAKSQLEHWGLLSGPKPTTSRHSQIAESRPEVPTTSSNNTLYENLTPNTKKRRAPMPPGECNTDDSQDSTEQR